MSQIYATGLIIWCWCHWQVRFCWLDRNLQFNASAKQIRALSFLYVLFYMKKKRFKISQWVSKTCFMCWLHLFLWSCRNVQPNLFHVISCHGSCFIWKKAVINNLNGFKTGFNYCCHPTEMNKSQDVLWCSIYMSVFPWGMVFAFLQFVHNGSFPWLV